jgi:hypothetical protein
MHPALADFSGSWRLSRAVSDTRQGLTGRFSGTAKFSDDGGGLLYRETGTLRYGDAAPIAAERCYRWQTDGTRISVLFDDGRPFHDFAPGTPHGTHWCDPDSYAVAYDFTRWPDWRATWIVTGPRKNYQMTSLYERSAATAHFRLAT